ncbi:tetratricopeptide repeat protein [Pedobacter xixiisoli]|uniref:Tetratricopeptide repeat-containing protein n=1 Tax=Pedobacter xixiisoli TaxID=1476464 RepID=A0A286AEZ2_9SPHI|nr:tetratricopeptide repeat protein [Pedobacter xixiisoli]SOD20465.1 Tetratricopeptide repeat-containing protein [Pedobacter xixiisoli]
MKHFLLLLITCCLSSTIWAQNNTDEALAYQYYQQADYEKAAVLLEKLFNGTRNDGYFDLYYTSLLKIKKYDEAETLVKRLIKQSPQKLTYQIALGRIYQESGKTAQADKIYQIAIQNIPKNEFMFRELANSFYRFEAYDMAVSTFLQGRKVLNDEQVFAFELLSIYRFKKDKPALIYEYLNALPANPQLLPQAQSILANLFESNNDYQALQSALLKKIQKAPDNEIFTELLIWQFIQQQEYEMALRQLIAQDRRTKTAANLLFNTANTFVANKAYPTAIKAYEYLITKGPENELYLPSKIQLINAKYELAMQGKTDQIAIKALANEFSQIITQYGINNQTVFALKKLSHLQAYYLNDLSAAEKTLEQALKVQGLPAMEIGQLKIDLGDIYVLNKQPWEAVLIYEQVSKQYDNLPVASDARYRSARLSFYQGNFKFAKSQADVLKASTSQLMANDALNLSLLISDNLQSKNDSLALMMYADAEMLQFINNNTAALKKLDSIDIAYPKNSLADDILMAKAKIFIKNNDFSQAETNLKQLISSHLTSIWIDDAIFTLAELYESKLNNTEEAKKLYQQLITDFPGSMLNAEARKRYRNLRGETV